VHGLDRGGGLAHDLDVAVLGQQIRDAAPHDLVVVEQENSDHRMFLPHQRPAP
jgi:hypothetical protein